MLRLLWGMGFTLVGVGTAFEAKVYSSARWQRLRARVLERDLRVCWVCGGEASVADHVVPMSVDASRAFDMSNVRAACVSCNASRSNRRFVGVRYPQRSDW